MRRQDLAVGGQYVFSSGQQWRPGHFNTQRCVLLDLTPGWRNHNWRLEGNTVSRWPGAYGGHAARLAVAVEVVKTGRSTINPDTGRPWTAEELLLTPEDLRRAGNWHVNGNGELWAVAVVSRLWYPYAARPAELKAPWQVQADYLAEKRAVEVAAYPVRLAEAAEAEAERAARQAERDRQNREWQVIEAQRTEFYEQRVAPRLIELGIEHTTVHGAGSGRIELTAEELARLLRQARHNKPRLNTCAHSKPGFRV